MIIVIRPDFEVVIEGRILYNPKDFTRLNLVASGTFSGDGQEKDFKKLMLCQRLIAHWLGIEAMQSDSTL
jgi:hypothetical protein